MKTKTLTKEIVSDDTGDLVTVNVTKIGRRYMKNGGLYCAYYDCKKCKNASWYDDDYCNNQKITFIDREGVKTTQVYCENYEIESKGKG